MAAASSTSSSPFFFDRGIALDLSLSAAVTASSTPADDSVKAVALPILSAAPSPASARLEKLEKLKADKVRAAFISRNASVEESDEQRKYRRRRYVAETVTFDEAELKAVQYEGQPKIETDEELRAALTAFNDGANRNLAMKGDIVPIAATKIARAERAWVTQLADQARRSPITQEITLSTPTVLRGAKTAVSISQSKALQWFLAILGKQTTESTWASHPKVLFGTGIGRVAGGNIAGIAAITDLITQIIELKDEIKKERAVEGAIALLQILEATSSIGDSIAVTAMGLETVGAIALNSVLWASPLSMVCAFTALVTIPVHMLNIHKTNKILDQLKNTPDLGWLSKELNDTSKDADYFLTRNFGILDREKAGSQVQYIIEKGSDSKREDLNDALQERLHTKISNHKLAILSAIIGIIGVSLIFFAAPVIGGVFSVGFGIIALSGALSFLRFMRERQSVTKLEKRIGELCNYDTIPDSFLGKHFRRGMDIRHSNRPAHHAWQSFEPFNAQGKYESFAEWHKAVKPPKIGRRKRSKRDLDDHSIELA